MISSVTIEGFKSFGSSSKPIYLGPLTFVVGANASGKSNFVGSLRFLRFALLHGLDYAVSEFGGCREVRNRVMREREQLKPCVIDLRATGFSDTPIHSGGKEYRTKGAHYRLEADLRSDEEHPSVISESLSVTLECAGNEVTYRLCRSQNPALDLDEVRVEDPTQGADMAVRVLPAPAEESAHLMAGNGLLGLPAVRFREWVSGWGFFSISPEIARLASKDTPGVELGMHGENLAAILHEIVRKNGDDAMRTILNGLQGAVPGINEIKPLKSDAEDKWTFQLVEDRIRALRPTSASDGTIRLLTILVAACWCSKTSSLLVIEEPENSLHPHLAEQLVATFRAASEKRQVLITTHSPAFLDYLKPDELLLCERDEKTTYTQITPASSRENIVMFQRKFSLSDLWMQGVLGGIP